jgi:hypothetical protein
MIVFRLYHVYRRYGDDHPGWVYLGDAGPYLNRFGSLDMGRIHVGDYASLKTLYWAGPADKRTVDTMLHRIN